MKFFKTVSAILLGVLLANAGEVEDLIGELGSGDKVKRREAARSLALLGPAARAAVPALIKGLDDDEEQVFFWSATALAKIGPDAHEATPELIKRLKRSGRRYKDQVHVRIVHALTQIGPAAMLQLTGALGSEHSSVRLGAVRVLGNLGFASREAAPRLFDLLADDSESVRFSAGSALGRIGDVAYPQIMKGLSADSATVRAAAAHAVVWIPANSRPAIHLAKRLAKETDNETKVAGLNALNRIGFDGERLLAMLLPALDSEEPRLRQEALSGILSLRPNSRAAVPHLIERLAAKDPSKRKQAIDLLGRMGYDASVAVPKLITGLGQADEEEKRSIRNALVEMGPASIPSLLDSATEIPLAKLLGETWQADCIGGIGIQAVSSLTNSLKENPGNGAGLLSLVALQKIGDKSPTTRQVILPWLEHEQAVFRGAALSALVASSTKPNMLMPRLQAAMGDPNSLVRQAAMDALASLGSSAKGATTALVNSLDDKDAAVQLSAIRAIGKLESDDSVLAERLVKFLDGANPETRLAVVVSLGGFRRLPDSAVNSLVNLLKVEHAETKSTVFGALAKLGSSAKPALPALNSALNHENQVVRTSALKALAKVESNKGRLLNALQAKLVDKASSVRHTAILELGELGSDARSVGPALFARFDTTDDRQVTMKALRKIRVRDVQLYISILHNEEPLVRFFACQALRRAGKNAKPAEDELRKLQKDSYDFVRREARRALESIE
ncbi:MAG: HEAT repeat domain-containing protein [Verrucomicrobiota bacterium]|nr:HEAT repeat domain-containing protein [Verrucomicrobiota bacterium]